MPSYICRLTDQFRNWYYFSCQLPTSSQLTCVNEPLRRQLSKLESTSSKTTWDMRHKSWMPSPNHYHKSNTANFGFFQFACELESECIDIRIQHNGYTIYIVYGESVTWALSVPLFFVCRLLHCRPLLASIAICTPTQDWYVYLDIVGCWHYNCLVFRIVFEIKFTTSVPKYTLPGKHSASWLTNRTDAA